MQMDLRLGDAAELLDVDGDSQSVMKGLVIGLTLSLCFWSFPAVAAFYWLS